MSDIESGVCYFSEKGASNTNKVLSLVLKRADELKIDTIVVASTRGGTGVEAVNKFKGRKVIVVTHSAGFSEPNKQQLTDENRKEIEKGGGRVLICQHAFGGIGRAVRKKFGTYMTEEIVAHTLRIFGEGMKVACEIVLMAADAGLIESGSDVISVGGTSRGADTAIVVKPVNVNSFFDMKVKEIICKPRLE
jgi:hypothetical protein